MAMFSVYKKNQLEASKTQQEGLRKLHFGRENDHQRTVEVLASARDVRDTKAPLAHSRFSDWVTSKVGTGEIQPGARKEHSIHNHQFRERVKTAEVGEKPFGVYYEKEKDRVERNVADHLASNLQREAWFKNQNGPIRSATSDKKPTGSALSARHFTDAERINAAIDDGAHSFDMHAGYGWKQTIIPKFRPQLPKNFGGEFVKPFFHDKREFAWDEPHKPNAIVEPYLEYSKRHKKLSDDDAPTTQKKSEARTKWDFDSKTDGRTRLNFAIPTPAPKPEPTARIKRYNNSLKGVTCFLPHSMTSGFEGDGEIQRQAKSIVAGI